MVTKLDITHTQFFKPLSSLKRHTEKEALSS